MKTHQLFLPVLLLLMTTVAYAQTEGKYDRNQTITLPSSLLNETRFVSIYLPDSYEYSKAKYPVLYLLDGGTHFQHASAAADYLTNRMIIPEIIVVAIHNIDRSRDFSPVHVEEVPTSGGAEKFLGFLSEELVPHMDESYRTAGFNILLGHSFGGTFIGYTMLAEPHLFDAYLAVSPYLMYADNYVVKQTSENLKPLKDVKYFYMTVGNEDRYFETLDEYTSILKEKAGENLEFNYVKLLDENHGTTPYLTTFTGLKFIFRDWQLPPDMMDADLESLDEHYSMVSKKYGMKVKTPEVVINALGYQYLQAGDLDMAIQSFKENVKRFPGSSNVYDSLGEAYENKGNTDEAAKNYQKAVSLGEKNGNPNLAIYKTNLERVSKE